MDLFCDVYSIDHDGFTMWIKTSFIKLPLLVMGTVYAFLAYLTNRCGLLAPTARGVCQDCHYCLPCVPGSICSS